MTTETTSKALLILFPDFNTLDVNGPLEVFRKSGKSTTWLCITIASETEITCSVEHAHMKRDTPLDDKLINELADYDLLIVPGGSSDGVQKAVNNTSSPFMRLVKAFAQLDPGPASGKGSLAFPRTLLSICTGATFLARLGIFNGGRYCTTHHAAYGNVEEICVEAAEVDDTTPGVVLPARFVDSGVNEHQVRVISSGGISCGMDACLHVVKMRVGEAEARSTAEMLDYAWRKTEGVVFGERFNN